MGESKTFQIGAEVVCRDGPCGELRRVVVDPLARTVTHLVVEPRHRQGIGRLVPIALLEPDDATIRLRCTKAEYERLEDAEETRFLAGAPGEWGYEQGQLLSLPYFPLSGALGSGYGAVSGPQPVIYDRVPEGTVEVRRGEPVHASDGEIGRVQGLVIDPADRHVTHFLLEEGHLWGRKRVAIPIGAVEDVTNGVRINLSRDQVRDLPPVDLADA